MYLHFYKPARCVVFVFIHVVSHSMFFRVGGKENYFHCSRCDVCLGIQLKESHKVNVDCGWLPPTLSPFHTALLLFLHFPSFLPSSLIFFIPFFLPSFLYPFLPFFHPYFLYPFLPFFLPSFLYPFLHFFHPSFLYDSFLSSSLFFIPSFLPSFLYRFLPFFHPSFLYIIDSFLPPLFSLSLPSLLPSSVPPSLTTFLPSSFFPPSTGTHLATLYDAYIM